MIGILLFNAFISKKLSNLMPKMDSGCEIRDMRLFCSKKLVKYLIFYIQSCIFNLVSHYKTCDNFPSTCRNAFS